MILECYDVLKMIEARPALWTGEISLKSIHTFLIGYYQALLDEKIVHKAHTDEPFYDWVANKLGYYESTTGWVNMILANCLGFKPKNITWENVFNNPITNDQHTKSIELFYKLIEEFKLEMDKNSQ